MEVAGLNVVRAAKDISKETTRYELSGFAAELAYRFFLALFPFFIFLAALGGFVANAADVQNPTEEVMQFLGNAVPEDADSLLRTQLEEVTRNQSPGLLSLGFIGALWAASSGIGALMRGFNRIYEVSESRSMVKRYMLCVGLTLLAGGSILASVILLIAGQTYGTQIAGELGLEGTAATAINLLRWPIIVVLLMTATAFLYWAAPNVKLPFKLFSPGAIFFVLSWLVASYLFGLYVSNFGQYNATYGALGGIVVLLIWFYLTGLLLLLGMELNAYLARQKLPDELAREGARVPDNETRTTAEADRWHEEAARRTGHTQDAPGARGKAEGVAGNVRSAERHQ